MFGFIYITTNTVNGKRYVGRCRYSRRRWKDYLGSGAALKRDIAEFGVEAFERDIVAEAETLEELEKLELMFLDSLGAVSDPSWYNVYRANHTTKGFTGRKHTQSRNEKVSDKLTGRKRPEHVIEILRQANLGKKRRPETVEKHRAYLAENGTARDIPVTIDGVTYRTITAARKATGRDFYTIKRIISGEEVQPKKVFVVVIDGVKYPTIKEAMKALGKGYHAVKRMAEEEKT